MVKVLFHLMDLRLVAENRFVKLHFRRERRGWLIFLIFFVLGPLPGAGDIRWLNLRFIIYHWCFENGHSRNLLWEQITLGES